MPQENQSELFIRLLANALEADRLTRTGAGSPQDRAGAKRPKQLFGSDHDQAMHAIGPMDCVQLMASATQDLRHG